jgi:hypothetical protein
LERNESGYLAVGTPKEASLEANGDKLLEALNDDDQTREQLMRKNGLTSYAFDVAVKYLGDKVLRNGKGVRGDPYLYRLNSIRLDSKPWVGRSDESQQQ